MPKKKIFVALLVIVVAIGGFVAGLYLLQQRQDLEEEAAVPGGQAEVSVQPETGNFNVGDTINMKVFFNPANISISGIGIRLYYPFSGSSPAVTVQSITMNQSLLSSGDWTCPVQEDSQEGGNVLIDIACANTSANGYRANTDTLLADVVLRVERQPDVSPFNVRFDNVESVITRKSDNEDILLIPTSTGSYTIGGQTTEPTATPTTVQASPTQGESSPTPTSELTSTPSPSPTATATTSATVTPTGKGGLPDAGISYPTILGLGAGILTLVGIASLAF